jgi:hypothetical protein
MAETNGKVAGAADLAAALKDKRRYKEVTLPASGLTVRIQSLAAGEQSRYETAAMGPDGKLNRNRMEDAESRLIVKCLVDEAGNRLFSDMQAGELAAWDGADAAFLYRECSKHCGINRQTDDLEKNFGETQPAGSLTA